MVSGDNTREYVIGRAHSPRLHAPIAELWTCLIMFKAYTYECHLLTCGPYSAIQAISVVYIIIIIVMQLEPYIAIPSQPCTHLMISGQIAWRGGGAVAVLHACSLFCNTVIFHSDTPTCTYTVTQTQLILIFGRYIVSQCWVKLTSYLARRKLRALGVMNSLTISSVTASRRRWCSWTRGVRTPINSCFRSAVSNLPLS